MKDILPCFKIPAGLIKVRGLGANEPNFCMEGGCSAVLILVAKLVVNNMACMNLGFGHAGLRYLQKWRKCEEEKGVTLK